MNKTLRYLCPAMLFVIFVQFSECLMSMDTFPANGAAASEKSARSGIGPSIKLSELIVVGTIGSDRSIKVREVLKGDPSFRGRSIPAPEIRVLCGPYPQPSNDDQAVLFSKNWQTKSNVQPFVEIYSAPNQIAALRCLIDVVANPSESAKLTTLSELWQDPASHCKARFVGDPKPLFGIEFIAAIADMREPQNFEIVANLVSKSAPEEQLKLLDWAGDTGDARAVPLLINALKSRDRFVKSSAATKLIYYYPGAAHVDEAILELLRTGPAELKPFAYRYLTKRKSKHDIRQFASVLPQPTAYQQAEELRTSGKTNEAIALYLSVIESPASEPYPVRDSALKIIGKASPAQSERMRKALLPLLSKDAVSGNYLEAADAAIILRGLHHPQCRDSLINLLTKQAPLFEKAHRTATMAIRELGTDNRKKAVKVLLNQIKENKITNSDEQTELLVSLAWLGDKADLEQAKNLIPPSSSWHTAYAGLGELFSLPAQSDEAKFLIAYVPKATSRQAVSWAMYRLGDLKDKRAVPVLISEFKANRSSPYVTDEALKAIGGVEVEKALLPIASNSKEQMHGNAINILCELQGQRALTLLRKLIRDKNVMYKTEALSCLGRLGSLEDLQYLIPMSDFWTGDRTNHYWIMQAISGIRDRHPEH